jgi:hypothetical protein
MFLFTKIEAKTVVSVKKTLFPFIILSMLMPFATQAQVVTPGSEQYDYLRILQLRQDSVSIFSNNYQTILYSAPDEIQHDMWGMFENRLKGDGFQLLPFRTRSTWNSAYAKSMNNGPVWRGRGLTQEFHGGFQARYGMLHITLNPSVYVSQNRPFELGVNPIYELEYEKSKFSYPFSGKLDLVQRYGDDPFFNIHPGQSDISLLINNFRTGVSTQNMIAGHAHYNPMLLSTNAPGFPHFYVGTERPFSFYIGHFEIKQIWGGLYESSHFDDNPANDWRYFTAFLGGWQPRFTKGLHLGFNRAFVQRGPDFQFFSGDLFATLYNFNNPESGEFEGIPINDAFDQVVSITARWTFSEVGFEPYFEFARNDFGGGPFGSTPDHTRAYTLGFTKIFDLPDASIFALTGELSNNGSSRTSLTRDTGPYYIHTFIEQGYTNGGQILGAGLGPGGIAYNLFMRRYSSKGMHGAIIQYMRINDDFYYTYFDDNNRHDYEYTFGYKGVVHKTRLNIAFSALFTWRQNMHMIEGNDRTQVQLGISLQYR